MEPSIVHLASKRETTPICFVPFLLNFAGGENKRLSSKTIVVSNYSPPYKAPPVRDFNFTFTTVFRQQRKLYFAFRKGEKIMTRQKHGDLSTTSLVNTTHPPKENKLRNLTPSYLIFGYKWIAQQYTRITHSIIYHKYFVCESITIGNWMPIVLFDFIRGRR